ncbi:MAG: DUF427 domain-containing protein [Alphaproteobacteria bacterium]|jgi:class 3 adenylate cyclase/uncharacterized protein (DUF427 family)|nr:DUF427 domain-containing protein [Alphaproteobacteria bacterium]
MSETVTIESAGDSADASKGGSLQQPYRIELVAAPGRVSASVAGVTVANSENAIVLHESYLPSGFYFPRMDVDTSLLRRSDYRTFCPFKGTATHWNMEVAGRSFENVAWSYERALEAALPVTGFVAFYPDVIEQISAEPGLLEPKAEAALSGRSDLADWVLGRAWQAVSSEELTEQLGRQLTVLGIPLMRLSVGIWTLHPQLVGVTAIWQRDRDGVEVMPTSRGALQSAEYLKSPVRFVSEGLGGVRQRLDVDDPEFQFPIMDDLRQLGGTDYVAMPLPFSDGQIHTLTLTSDQPEGFSVADLGQLFLSVPLLSRLYEVHTLRHNTAVLLDTYLGARTGKRVLEGLTQRGDGEGIDAVIWFCDLRDSTALAESLPRDQFLEDLNLFFDGVAGAVLEHGGEVLRFIGDAVLAIFPVGEGGAKTARACTSAIDAARDAERRMIELNEARAETGRAALGYGIGLHLGEVSYGNIGTTERLEFTVIGAAANQAARIEGLTKTLGRKILISDDFAREYPQALVSLGRHALRGVDTEREIFTLPAE